MFNHIPFYHHPCSLTIAVSGCLNGDALRYDGGHKHIRLITDFIGQYAQLMPLCPEAQAGLGTPRPPMQLVQTQDGIKALRIEDGSDLTPKLMAWIAPAVQHLNGRIDGAILKKRSPSCGIQTTPLYAENGDIIATTSGLFAESLAHLNIVLVDEEWLCDEQRAQDFLLRCLLLKESLSHQEDALLQHYRSFIALENLQEWRNLLRNVSLNLPF